MAISRVLALLLMSGGLSTAVWSHAPRPVPSKPVYGSWGVDYASMDLGVKPGTDFFGYAEGTWLKNSVIPPDKISAGYSSDMQDLADRDVREIAEDAQRHPSSSMLRKIGDYYAAWMDQTGIDARGLGPARPYLARITAISSREQLVLLMAEPSFASPLEIRVKADEKDPARYTVSIEQARLGLPERDFYLVAGAKYEAIRKAYRSYITRIETLAGQADASAKADRIVALETRFAKAMWAPERLRDPNATYNPMMRAQLTALAPQLAWRPMLAHIGLSAMPTIIVEQPSAVATVGHLLDDVPLATWKDWLTFRFLSDHAQFLPRAFDNAKFDYYGRTLDGVQRQSDRWQRGVYLLNNNLGDAVGQLYVKKRWSAEIERQITELIEDIRAAYADKISHAEWMDVSTRNAALEKIAAFEPRIGHPMRYTDYTKLQIDPHNPLANAVNADWFAWELRLSRLGKPVDRTVWAMPPQAVNAYYYPELNQITFPAAILQPPYFDPAADPAVNYGEAGATIGHEIGHGFDDEGRQFDAHGRLVDWWTRESADRYKTQVKNLVKQFDAYEPLPGIFIKGELTLGENLADLGGLEAAYAAYRRYVARHGDPKLIDGYTGDQRFFIAYAQNFQGKDREDALRTSLLSDPHSPNAYRVNGIVRNVDAWYAAFGVKPGDKLYLSPGERVHVW